MDVRKREDGHLTLLQTLLMDGRVAPGVVADRLGCDRATVFRWQTGRSLPSARYARQLVELLRPHGLDFNGCYWPLVQEAGHGE